MVQLLSVREMRYMTRHALETHKLDLCLAKVTAATELEREAIDVQLQRAISLLNEYRPMEVR